MAFDGQIPSESAREPDPSAAPDIEAGTAYRALGPSRSQRWSPLVRIVGNLTPVGAHPRDTMFRFNVAFNLLAFAGLLSAQGTEEHKRILWIIPNYRTASVPVPYRPLSTKQKFDLAFQDSFDRGTMALGLAFGAYGQLNKATPSFGDGVSGYARYASTAYTDLVIGDYMTEAIYPSLLHQDPRYFRRGTGGTWSRFGYAVGQIFWTHNDSGKMRFNYSEVAGNATAVAISNAYYPDNRNAQDAAVKLGLQLGVDATGNVLKEFWPDIRMKLTGHPDSR